jgi:hypothetical protein
MPRTHTSTVASEIASAANCARDTTPHCLPASFTTADQGGVRDPQAL